MAETEDRMLWTKEDWQAEKIRELGAENAALLKTLEDLTPGGSEFHGEPERCVTFIRERLAFTAKAAKKNKELREALGAADKKIIVARSLSRDAMTRGELPENEHAIKLVNADIELREARALIDAALKGV